MLLHQLVLITLLHSWSYPATAVVNATDTYIRHRRRERVLPRGVIPLNRRRIEEAEKKKASNDNFPLIFIQIDGSDTGIVGAADGFETPPTMESRAVDGMDLGATNEPSKSSTPWPSINDAISNPWPSINDGISSPRPSVKDVRPASQKPSSTPTSSPTTEEPSSEAPTPNPSDSPTSESPTSNEPTSFPTTKGPTLKPTTTPTTTMPSEGPTLKPVTESPTYMPTYTPTSTSPTSKPTSGKPSSTPTSSPTTEEPSSEVPTPNPSDSPTSESPTSNEPTLITTTTLISRSITTGPTLNTTDEVIPTYYPTYMPTYTPTSTSPTSKPTEVIPTYYPTYSSSTSTGMPSEGPTLNPVTGSPITDLPTSTPFTAIIEEFSLLMSMVEMSIHTVESPISLSMKMIDLSVPKELYEVSMSISPVQMPLSLDLHDIYTESMSIKYLELSMPVVDVSLSMKMINLSAPMELNEMSMSMEQVKMPLSLELNDFYTEITDLFSMPIAVLELSTPAVDVSVSMEIINSSAPMELNEISMSMAQVEMPLPLELHDIYTEITDLFSMPMSVLELSTPFVDDESLSMDAIEIPLELNDMILDFHGEIISEPTSSEPTINPTYRLSTQWPTYEPTSSPMKASANPSNEPSSRLSGNPSFDSSVGPSIPLNELSFTTTETPTMLPSKSLTENPSTNSPSATSLVPTFGGTYSTISAKIATYSPTRTPSTAPAANEANAQLELKGVDSEMDDEATLVFIKSCSSFVEDSLLGTMTSSLIIECKITNQQMSSGGRRLRGDERGLIGVVRGLRAEPSLLVDVTIEGSATSTYAAADSSEIDFSTEVIDAFASQSSEFTKQLKGDGNKAGIKYFDNLTSTSVDSIDGDSAANEIVTSTGDLNSRESAKTTSSNGPYIIVIATACLTSIVLAVFAYITITTQKKTSPHGELVEEDDETSGNILNDLGAIEAEFIVSPKCIQHEPSSWEESVLSILTEGPVHQTIEIVTPQGKLGIVVTTHPEGPAVYSIKNESPLQGLIFVDDLIVAIDGEDTRGWTAQSFVKIVAKKNGAPCKLTVLRTIVNNEESPMSLR